MCWVNGVDSDNSTAEWNATEILYSIPKTDSGKLDSCHVFGDNNETVPCTKWVFDSTYTTSSQAIEWSLVCDKRWMAALVQTVYMMGVFTGAMVLGRFADKVGRKIVFCWSAVLQLILGVGVAFIPEYWSFLVVRYFFGIVGSAGCYIPGFVLTMELMGSKRRTACGVAMQTSFAGGIILVAGWAAFVKDRQILQVIYGLHALLLIPHIWIMDESPRWLWAQGRIKEAVDIIEKGLKCNKFNESFDKAAIVSRGIIEASKDIEITNSVSAMDLMRTPNLRHKTLNMCVCFFANALVYYGLSLNTGTLLGNPYIIMAVAAAVEIPSYIIVIYFLDVWGRRPMIVVMLFVGGLACISVTFLPGGTVTTVIVMIGKLFIAGSFAIVYNYAAELFPTVIRNTAIGLTSMFARLSGALTPLITLLDSFDPKIPAILFGAIAILSALLCCFLPETMNQPMPQTLSDGEYFGKGDTLFSSWVEKDHEKSYNNQTNVEEATTPLDNSKSKVVIIR